MKKLMTFLLIAFFPIIILAKDYEYENINIKLSINDDYMVITRDNLENNSDLSKLNVSKETMEDLMNKNNIYFDIIKNDVSYEILIVVPDKEIEGWNNFVNATDELLNEMKDLLANQVGAKESNVYKNKQNYIIVDYYDEKTGYYIVNYYTVVNSRGYNIQLQKTKEITDDERKELKEIVDSVEIKVLDDKKEETDEQKQAIDNYNKKGFDYMRIVYGAIIGAVAGLISYIIGLFIRKKKSSV